MKNEGELKKKRSLKFKHQWRKSVTES